MSHQRILLLLKACVHLHITLEGGPGLGAQPFIIVSLVPRLLRSFAMYCLSRERGHLHVVMSSSSAYGHAAVTIDITCNNVPPNLIAVLCGEIGARLGLQWSRGLVTSDYTDGDGSLGDSEGTDREPPSLTPTEVGGLRIQTENSHHSLSKMR